MSSCYITNTEILPSTVLCAEGRAYIRRNDNGVAAVCPRCRNGHLPTFLQNVESTSVIKAIVS